MTKKKERGERNVCREGKVCVCWTRARARAVDKLASNHDFITSRNMLCVIVIVCAFACVTNGK